jgi:hypothetical protein
MITGINRLQRPGRSYLHGVLRDAARPFAYRGGARRLLRAESASGLRPLYGNHFMPVAFRYLDARYGYYEYGSTPAPAVGPVQSAAVPRAVTSIAAPAGNSASAAPDAAVKKPAGHPVSAVSVVAPKTESTTPARDIQAPVSSGGVMPQRAATIDIRIPGGDPLKTARPAARATAPVLHQDAVEPEQERQAEPKTSRPSHAVPQPQRLPPDLSLGTLAKMLERQNFERSEIKAGDESPASNAPLRSAHPVVANESAGVKVSPRAHRTAQAAMPRRNASIKPVAAASAAEPARMAARVAARPTELRLSMPRRAAPANSARASRSAPDSGREPRQKAGTARGPARAAGRERAQSTRRVTVIRRSAPAAFWERSYLSAFELRMFR